MAKQLKLRIFMLAAILCEAPPDQGQCPAHSEQLLRLLGANSASSANPIPLDARCASSTGSVRTLDTQPHRPVSPSAADAPVELAANTRQEAWKDTRSESASSHKSPPPTSSRPRLINAENADAWFNAARTIATLETELASAQEEISSLRQQLDSERGAHQEQLARFFGMLLEAERKQASFKQSLEFCERQRQTAEALVAESTKERQQLVAQLARAKLARARAESTKTKERQQLVAQLGRAQLTVPALVAQLARAESLIADAGMCHLMPVPPSSAVRARSAGALQSTPLSPPPGLAYPSDNACIAPSNAASSHQQMSSASQVPGESLPEASNTAKQTPKSKRLVNAPLISGIVRGSQLSEKERPGNPSSSSENQGSAD